MKRNDRIKFLLNGWVYHEGYEILNEIYRRLITMLNSALKTHRIITKQSFHPPIITENNIRIIIWEI